LSDLTATTIAEINAVIGAGTALAHDLGAPNRISVPDLPLAADAFTIGGTLDLSSVAVVGDLELQAFRVLGQTFTFTATPVVGQNDIDISAAATVADATAAAIGVINTTLGAGTALAHDAAAPNRLTVPNLPTAGDSFVLSNDLTIPAELGGNLEGESFFAFGQIFTFTDTPVAATDIQINPADTGDTIATAAAAIINGVVGGGDRASAAGAGGVLQLNAFDSRFGETVQLPNGAAVLGDSLTVDGITFDFVATPSFFPTNPEIIVAAGNSSTFVAFLTANEINAQFGVGTAVRDGDKLLLTTGTVTSEIGATSTGAIAINGAGTTLTFAGTGATVIGEILSVGGMQYTFIDTTGGGVPGASEIGVLPADAADVVAAAAQGVLAVDFPGDVTVLTNVITLANGLTAEDNILLDAPNVPGGLTFGTEVNADAVGTPLVIDAADTTLVDSPLDPATSPLSASNANRVTVFSATETDMTSMSAVLTLAGGAGVTVGNTAVVLSDVNATANEVAVEIRQALANVFSPIGGGPIGDITNIKGAENLIRVIGHDVTDPGPLGMTGKLSGALPGDVFGAYEAGATDYPGSLRGMNNAVEGVHVDDIIIGFAERGEMVINAPAGTGFTSNLDVENANYPAGQSWLGIDVGEYDVEIRRVNDFGETQGESPTNALGRSIDTNDREAQLVSVTLPRLSEDVQHASTVTVSDGVDSVTFQFLDQNETTIPGSGLFPILFDPLTDEPYTLAAELRDAINQPIVQGILDVKAALSDGTDSGTASTSSTVHLTGNATVTGSNEAIVATSSIGAVTVSPLGSSFSTSDGVETLGAPLPGTAILVDGTPFFFVDGAVTPMPTPTQIAVLVTDTAVQVAAKAAVVLDAFFPAAVSSSANIVNLPTGIIVEDFDSFGDQNHHRDQGQLIIHSSFVTDSSNFGISVDAGVRENNTRPRPGSVRNLQVLNSSRLATSVVITNNVVAGNISGGIQFSGDQTNNPSGIVPYGRIVNNTIVGVGTGTGILVTQSASPTLMNNIVADFNTGISVDASSLAAGTTIGSTLYRIPAPNQPTAGIGLGTFPLQLSAADPLFVDQVNRNYYLAPLSSAIDSGLETLGDRPALVSVKGPLGLGTSPILSPKLDVYGQLRGDDGDAPNTSGQGGNVFIDRGAIDRVDFFRPRASLVSPLDQSLVTPVDLDPALDRVSISGPDLVREFTIKLTDEGIGIDTINVVSEQFVLLQEGVPLLEGVSYLWRYNSSTGDVTFQSPTAFTTDRSYEIRVKNTAAVVNDPNDIDGVKDLAGNFLVPNQIDGTTRFFISLSDGVNDAPINAVPGDQTTPEDTVFTFASGTPDAISVSDSDAHLGNNELTVTLLADHGAVPVITVGPSQDTLRFPAATTLVGQTVDIRDQRTADTTTTFTFVDAAPADNTEIQIDPAVDDATAVASAVAAAVSAALPAAPAAAPAGDTVTLVAGVTAEGLYFTSSAIGVAGADQITVLDAATVVGEQLTINSPTLGSVIFTYVDINVVTSPARNEIGVDANAGTANDVAAATVAAINDVKMFGAGASSATLAVIDLTGGLSASDSDGTSIQVNGLVITVPDGATVIGEEINVDGTIFRYVDAAIVVGPTTTEIAVDVTDLAAQVAVATQLVLNAHGAVVGTASASVDTVSLDAGTVATVVPLTLAGSRLTMPAGAAVIGDHIAVGGSVFTFVDAAVVTAPTATEIAVNAGDSPTDVATTTATVLNTAFPGSAGSAMDVVTVDGVAVSGATPAAGQAVVTISGDVSLVNQALGDLPFLPATDYFGPALLTVYSEDFGQFTHDPVGRIHESDLDVVAFDVTPVNDAPRIGMIADDAVDEDVDVVMPVGNDEHEVIVPGVADGPINEDEAIVVTAALNVTTNIAMPNGANAMGQSLTINGTVFAYVATAPSGLTEIQVSNGDSSQQVAAATEAALNAFPALSAISIRSAFNFVSLSLNSANITASSSDFAISDHDALLSVVNPVVNDVLKYTTALNAFGMVDVVVTVTDAGLDGILFNGDDAQVSDTFTITVRPINDDPTLDAITDISVSEDTDTTPADGNNDEQNVSLTGIT
ncbi:MAG: hypothetical protein GY758_33760, partial [Fuerstiella sp.]|nr:hypothetical protein [Fuerstiella sp.]